MSYTNGKTLKYDDFGVIYHWGKLQKCAIFRYVLTLSSIEKKGTGNIYAGVNLPRIYAGVNLRQRKCSMFHYLLGEGNIYAGVNLRRS